MIPITILDCKDLADDKLQYAIPAFCNQLALMFKAVFNCEDYRPQKARMNLATLAVYENLAIVVTSIVHIEGANDLDFLKLKHQPQRAIGGIPIEIDNLTPSGTIIFHDNTFESGRIINLPIPK